MIWLGHTFVHRLIFPNSKPTSTALPGLFPRQVIMVWRLCHVLLKPLKVLKELICCSYVLLNLLWVNIKIRGLGVCRHSCTDQSSNKSNPWRASNPCSARSDCCMLLKTAKQSYLTSRPTHCLVRSRCRNTRTPRSHCCNHRRCHSPKMLAPLPAKRLLRLLTYSQPCCRVQ